MKRHFSFRYFFSEGVHSIFQHGIMSFAAVCMIICCLLIMGSFSLVAVNVDHMLGDLEANNQFTAYVDETYDTQKAQSLKATIEAVPNVSRAEFMTREEAQQKDKQKNSGNPLFDDLPSEVYRDRYYIYLEDISLLTQTEAAVKQVEGVADTNSAPEIAEGFIVMRNIAQAVAVILVVILLAMSLFIIVNTIKLATFNRREEIAIMKMCGATNAFVRWPFIFEGMILGLVGAVLGFFIQWGVYAMVGQAISTSDTIELITVLPFGPMAPNVLGVFAAMGLVIGAGGSLLAIRKFLQV